MTESANKIHVWCTLCELNNKERAALVLCPQCNQALCSECDLQHKVTRPLKGHTTISVEDYNSLPDFITSVKSVCEEHDRTLELYCPDHREPCCLMCLVDAHRCCAGILPLESILSKRTVSDLLSEYENNVDDIDSYLHKSGTEYLESLAKFQNQIHSCEKEMTTFRKTINEQLDQCEAELLGDLHEAFLKYKQDTKELTTKMNEIHKDVKQLKRNLENIKEHATVLQIFLASPKIESFILEMEKSIQGLEPRILLKEIDKRSLHISDWGERLGRFELKDKINITSSPSSYFYYGTDKKKGTGSRITSRPSSSNTPSNS